MKARILVIEDEPAINNLLCMNLEVTGYQTVSYLDGNDASEGIAWDHEFQCALVDIMLPGKDGYTLLPELNHYGIPVIFLTARADIASKVKGLKEGAEDYIVKPFEMLEVMVRLEKVLERHGNLQEQIQIDDITIDTISHTVTRNGEEIYLKPMEYNCLMMFVRNPNKALTREQLLAGLWGVEFEGETRTVDAHVGRIRKKLGWQDRIKTIPRIGYRLEGGILKLFTKIFLQVACVILILSSAVFFYTSYRWKNQSIQYINNYEYTKFQNNLLQFEEKLRLTSSQSANSDEKVRNRILIYAFRQIFHDSAVLYQNDEELYNGTAYDFDVQGIQEQLGEVELHGKWYDADTYICDPLISKADGKTLLLFFIPPQSQLQI